MSNRPAASPRLAFLLALWVLPLLSQEPQLQEAPLNPAFEAWLKERQEKKRPLPIRTTWEGHRITGHIPEPFRYVHDTTPDFSTKMRFFDATYDLRTLSRLTAVRNQNPYGTCWSFGAMASLESSQLTFGRGIWDLSEWYLAWFAYNDFSFGGVNWPAFDKDPIVPPDDETFDQGGSNATSTALMARGTGPVTEASAPYQNVKPYDPGTIPDGSQAVAVPLRHALVFPISPSNLDSVKGAVQTYGAVSVSMFWDDASYTGGPNYAYRYAPTGSTNHIVSIVGWDDNFALSKFPGGNQPAANGAWIVRNSWGSGWGDSGYFYMSYDSYFYADAVVFLSDSTTYTRIYQYDPLGVTGGIGYGVGIDCYIANVFTAAATEYIHAVAITASYAGANYQLLFYTGVTGDPSSGTLVAASTQSGTATYAGYHTVSLDHPFQVTNGQKFAVVVRYISPSYAWPGVYEKPNAGWTSKATANANESWFGSNGSSWTDLTVGNPNTNFCIKALSKGATLVNLEQFQAKARGRGIFLEWRTGSESENAGFHLWRRSAGSEVFERLTHQLVPARADGYSGGSYSWVDRDVESGQVYQYKLEDISTQGLSTFHGPVQVQAPEIKDLDRPGF